jgi:hypothetical protein
MWQTGQMRTGLPGASRSPSLHAGPPSSPAPPRSSPHLMSQSPYSNGAAANRSPYFAPMSPGNMPAIGGLQASTPGDTPVHVSQDEPHKPPPFPNGDSAGSLSLWGSGVSIYSSAQGRNPSAYAMQTESGAGVGSMSPSMSPSVSPEKSNTGMPRFGILGTSDNNSPQSARKR